MASEKITGLSEGTSTDPAADFLVYVDVSDTTQSPTGTNKKIKPDNLGVGGNFEYQTAIASSQNLTSTEKGLNKMYPIDSSSSDITLTVTTGSWVENDVINIERNGENNVIISDSVGVRIRGVFNVLGQYIFNNDYSWVTLTCRGTVSGNLEFTAAGRLTSGGSRVTTSSYSSLNEGDTAVDVTVSGSGFHSLMLDPVITGNATLNSWVFVNDTTITLNMTATGVETDQITITYDNNLVFVDTNAITLGAATVFLFDTHPFDTGYGLIKLKSTQTYGVRVRRSSDDAEVDVEFDTSNKTSLSSTISAGGDLTTWATTDDVFIVTWYNQGSSGATFDSTQATKANQYKILNAGALISLGSQTWADADGTNDTYATTGTANWSGGSFSLFSNNRNKSASNSTIISSFSTTTTQRQFFLRYDATNVYRFNTADESGAGATIVDSPAASINTNNQVAAIKGTNVICYLNGTAGTSGALPSTNPSESTIVRLGDIDSLAAPLDGYANYSVIYLSDQTSNRTSIESILSALL